MALRPDTSESEADREARYQRIMNSHPVPDRPRQRRWNTPVPVRMRLVWQRDGEEWTETTATHWARVGGAVLILVVITDLRRKTIGAWLDVGDVEPLKSRQQ